MNHLDWWISKGISSFVDPGETTVVTGFWRSGTTWLQQSIADVLTAKTVVEPLYPKFEEYRKAVLLSGDYSGNSHSHQVPFMPYADSDTGLSDPLQNYLYRSLVGSLPGVHVRFLQYKREEQNEMDGLSKAVSRIRNAVRTRVVAKFTRAHLLLGELSTHFQPRILHIRRDPRAVIASILRADWEWLSNLSLVHQLLKIDDGRRKVFGNKADILRTLDQMGKVARLAGYWACVEQHVRRLEEDHSVTPVRYEKLVRNGADSLAQVLPETKTTRNVLSGESATTQTERKGISTEKRLYGWKEELSMEEIEDVECALELLEATNLLPDKAEVG